MARMLINMRMMAMMIVTKKTWRMAEKLGRVKARKRRMAITIVRNRVRFTLKAVHESVDILPLINLQL